jgi:hypothetical protein
VILQLSASAFSKRKAESCGVVSLFGQIHHAGVILKDLARTATTAIRVHIRRALDPSQAQDDAIVRGAKLIAES